MLRTSLVQRCPLTPPLCVEELAFAAWFMFGRSRVAKLALSSLLLSPAHGLRLYPALSTTRLRGGSSSFAMSATATVEAAPAAPVEKFRLDYAAPPYAIDTVHLDFHIAEEETLVKTRLEIKRGAGVADGTPMVLDGDAEVHGGVNSSGCHMSDGPSAAQPARLSADRHASTHPGRPAARDHPRRRAAGRGRGLHTH